MHKLVAICGVDGTGKSTTSLSLAETLGAFHVKSPSEPFASHRTMVDSGVSALTRYFFYRAALQHDSRQISELLKKSDVVCDRYILSTYHYHAVMDPRVEGIFETTGLVQPHLTVVLTASSDVRKQRLAQRLGRFQPHDKHFEKNLQLQDTVDLRFRSSPNVFVIDTGLHPLENVVKSIIDRMEGKQDHDTKVNEV